MRAYIWIAATATLFSLNAWAQTDSAQQPIPVPRAPAQSQDGVDTTPVDMGSDSVVRHHSSNGSSAGYGVMVQGYYDPLSNFNKLQTSFSPQNMTNSTGTGMGGLQVLAMLQTESHFEFGMGFDYIFPINEQGQQSYTSFFAVNSQQLNIMGFEVAHVGYQIAFNNFALVPYGGLGIYYGKDTLSLATGGPGSSLTDNVTFSKLMMTFTAGVRGDFNFSKNFALNASVETIIPTNIATQLSQSGGVNAELPGYESNLQPNMDFWTSVGIRLMVGVKANF